MRFLLYGAIIAFGLITTMSNSLKMQQNLAQTNIYSMEDLKTVKKELAHEKKKREEAEQKVDKLKEDLRSWKMKTIDLIEKVDKSEKK